MKKNNTLKYTFTKDRFKGGSKEWGKMFLEKSSPGSSCWFKNLPSNISKNVLGVYIPKIEKFIQTLLIKGHKGPEGRENLNKVLQFNNSFTTAKTCPGIRGILKHSILIKSPCDIRVCFNNKTKEWNFFNTGAEDELIEIVEEHSAAQFYTIEEGSTSNLFKGKRVIKFKFPIALKAEEPYIMLGASYHSALPFQVVNGVIEGASLDYVPLSVIGLIDSDTSEEFTNIVINKGDAIAYLWSSSPLRLEYSDSLENTNVLARVINARVARDG